MDGWMDDLNKVKHCKEGVDANTKFVTNQNPKVLIGISTLRYFKIHISPGDFWVSKKQQLKHKWKLPGNFQSNST